MAALRSRVRVTPYAAGIAAALVLAVFLGLFNAIAAPGHIGYDSEQNVHYAHDLVYEGERGDPNDQNAASYKPPGFYLVAGSLYWLGDHAGMSDPRKLVQLLHGLLLVAVVGLTIVLARLVWPARRFLHVAAGLAVALIPIVPKTAAMFHPGLLALAVSTAALVQLARMLRTGSFRLRDSALLAVLTLAGLGIAAAGVFTYVAVLAALLAAGLVRFAPWRALALPAGLLLGSTVLLAAPVWIKAIDERGTPFLSGTPNTRGGLLHAKPLAFYVDLGWPQVVERPVRPAYNNRLLPTAYTELWGDYFGVWAWAHETPPDARVMRELRQQSWVGLLPTLLGIGGWLVLLARLIGGVVRRRLGEDALAGLAVFLPGVALGGFLYYAIMYLSFDGDTAKATFMLSAAPCWALCMAWALDRVRRLPVVGMPVLVLTAGGALLSLPFLVYGRTLFGLL